MNVAAIDLSVALSSILEDRPIPEAGRPPSQEAVNDSLRRLRRKEFFIKGEDGPMGQRSMAVFGHSCVARKCDFTCDLTSDIGSKDIVRISLKP